MYFRPLEPLQYAFLHTKKSLTFEITHKEFCINRAKWVHTAYIYQLNSIMSALSLWESYASVRIQLKVLLYIFIFWTEWHICHGNYCTSSVKYWIFHIPLKSTSRGLGQLKMYTFSFLCLRWCAKNGFLLLFLFIIFVLLKGNIKKKHWSV